MLFRSDLNHMAIYGAMDLYNVQDKRKCFDKIRKIFYHFQKENEEGNAPEDLIKEYKHIDKNKPKEKLGKIGRASCRERV